MTMMEWVACGAAVLALYGAWRFYGMMMSTDLKYHSFWYKVKAKLVFWVGDIRRIGAFPWLTWATKHHRLSYKEMIEALEAARPGDVGLHKDDGYASNLPIPGGFKHAWVHVEDGYIVEAISDGVVKRGALAPLVTDYAVILRPRGATQEQADRAVARANSIVGSDYDANFNFDFEESDEYVKVDRSFSRNLGGGKFHPAFSCTEVAGFAWYHMRDALRIFRSKHAGRDAIIADDYLRMNFDIVWLSESATPEWAEDCGMPEEAVQKIRDHLSKK